MAFRLLFIAPLALALGCTPTPLEVDTDLGDGSGTTGVGTTAGPSTMPPEETSAGTMGVSGTTGMTSSVDTTAGGSTGDSSGGSSSDDGPPVCPAPCNGNQMCQDGSCVDVCNPWGTGNYNDCLNRYGGRNATTYCGADHSCVYYGNPMEAVSCMAQSCVTACDCPGPLDGDAVVTCADITTNGVSDCYLSCGNGETCPAGMMCYPGASDSYCMHPVPSSLPRYGNCGNVDAPCDPGLQCVEESGYAICMDTCGDSTECGTAPPGSMYAPDCGDVIDPPTGPECYLPCGSNGDCPRGMDCASPDGDLCMWPSMP